MEALNVRPAEERDAGAVARLLGTLGYPAGEEAVGRRLRRLAEDPSHATLVAEEPDGAVTGVVAVMRGWALNHDEAYARIVALVVDPGRRRRGTGAALVRAAEAWGRAMGAGSIHLTTATHRQDAHGFYRDIGYQMTGLRFHRKL